MKARSVYFLLFGLLFGSQYMLAQSPFYSQYMVDKFLVNPAIAGANGVSSVNLISRQQYVGFVNAPQTFALTGQTRLIEDSYIMRAMRLRKDTKKKSRSGRVGLGGSIYSDRNGIVHRTGAQFTYAYHINVSNEWQISGGISVMGYQYRIDDGDVPYLEIGDPMIETTRKSFFVPDASTGAFVTNGQLYAGFGITDLLGSYIKLGKDVYGNFSTPRKYNVMAGYKIPVTSLIDVEPSILVQGTRTNFSMDISARMYYMQNYWAALSYRSTNSLILILGGRFDMFYLGYAYDLNLGLVQSYTSGSHELILGVRFGDNNTRRFRWFKQDERNFEI